MNFPVISLIVETRPNKLLNEIYTYLWNLIEVNRTKLNLNLIELVIVLSNFFLKKKDVTMGMETYISLAFLLSPKKKLLFCKLQLFSQNTHVLHLPEGFFHIQKL